MTKTVIQTAAFKAKQVRRWTVSDCNIESMHYNRHKCALAHAYAHAPAHAHAPYTCIDMLHDGTHTHLLTRVHKSAEAY